jgi:hypothetical protein
MNQLLPISSTAPLYKERIASLFFVNTKSVDHLKPPLSILIVETFASKPLFLVSPTLRVTAENPIEPGSWSDSHKSVVFV